MILAEHKTDFKFKGKRNYIHGTDMYDKLLAHVDGFDQLDMQFRAVCDRPLKLIEQDSIDITRSNPVSIKVVFQGKSRYFSYVFDDEKMSVEQRYVFDEDALVSQAVLSAEKTAMLKPVDGYTDIESVVAVNKVLLNHAFQGASVQWLFVRLKLNGPLDFKSNLTLKVIKNIGLKLVETEIICDNRTVGSVFFSAR